MFYLIFISFFSHTTFLMYCFAILLPKHMSQFVLSLVDCNFAYFSTRFSFSFWTSFFLLLSVVVYQYCFFFTFSLPLLLFFFYTRFPSIYVCIWLKYDFLHPFLSTCCYLTMCVFVCAYYVCAFVCVCLDFSLFHNYFEFLSVFPFYSIILLLFSSSSSLFYICFCCCCFEFFLRFLEWCAFRK